MSRSDSVYPVAKDVPIPSRRLNGSGNAKYPWATLEVGDSFLVPIGDRHPHDKQRNLYSALYTWNRGHDTAIKITVRTEGAAVRCWRIA